MFNCLKIYYKCLGLTVDVLILVKDVKQLFYSLYDQYVKFMVHPLILTLNKMPIQLKLQPTELVRVVNCYFKKKKSQGFSFSLSTQISTSELKSYLTTSFEFVDTHDFDLLQWWKEHQRQFSILAIISKQILKTSILTATVEQEFNAGGNMLDATRSFLSQACLDNWTKAQYRQQEIDQEPSYDYFKNYQTIGTNNNND